VQQSIVAYDETQKPTLKKALLLGDAISDLPKASAYYTFRKKMLTIYI
jgi:DNA (cytosine-5)-methyltransferase 1